MTRKDISEHIGIQTNKPGPMAFAEAEAVLADVHATECKLSLEEVLALHILPLKEPTRVGLTCDSAGYSDYVVVPVEDGCFRVEVHYQSQCGWRHEIGYGPPFVETRVLCRSRVEVALVLMFDEPDVMDSGPWSVREMQRDTPHLFAALMEASQTIALMRSVPSKPNRMAYAIQAICNSICKGGEHAYEDPACFITAEQVRRAKAIMDADSRLFDECLCREICVPTLEARSPDLAALVFELAPHVVDPIKFAMV
jgi:hypothetical protein